ncbi:BirA family transcriptional regulator, biotin operon repressor / biotin-[acetyl-CoA-carboxylase] ligase [Tenacibaculum sp. MAR_2009_124]|uniref:biotin--[acetyl-CoA-carboxylase] ligase n=1 Tax=Tenacibaculum sp. MAR_2009_124 TaxID=1250059 RepID=UPI00089B3047|nr:biotin--[acetyl-CoA-carboxylase] ligase [Tenacibaculum sp. MAR_2009_124]SEC87444.1 BirA family transcriptional regulator, biotin operon repressor / biotin-[acetyl-CoA-carboxylase] ligase [Tenacibaculum sp. MAR_2009_124]
MKIIKLDAIDSTNSFLKNMAEDSSVENFTVVWAKNQTAGRGQMKTQWIVKEGANLTFSVFVRPKDLNVTNQKFLNFSIALSVYETLLEFEIPKTSIKWPNDIMSGSRKICGVLVENTLKGTQIFSSVIGIGLNVNQNFLSEKSFKATSMKDNLNRELELKEVLDVLLNKLVHNFNELEKHEYLRLEERYLDVLYKKNVPSMFKTDKNVLFMGKIIGVSSSGKLQIELSNETIQEFGIKEVSFA